MKVKIACSFCGLEFLKYQSQIKSKNYCSRTCKNEHQKTFKLSEETKAKISASTRAENNPNFGNKWSEEKRKKHSENIKKLYNEKDGYREAVGKSNRGKKFSEEVIKKMHGHRTKESYSRIPSEETKRLIGIKSAEKFTDEFKSKFRKQMEEKGLWVPLNRKSDYDIYFKEANWIEKMFDYIEDIEQLQLLREYKVFNKHTNPGGVVRDHIYSRSHGFNESVFPEILRHPCNCQILLHRKNVSKRMSVIQDLGFTKEELFDKIKSYRGKWKEHQLVLEKINLYELGYRWKNEYSID